MWQGETFQTLNFSPSFALRIVMFFFFLPNAAEENSRHNRPSVPASSYLCLVS